MRTALDSLSTKQAGNASSAYEVKGYDAKPNTAETIPLQVLENMVELVGIEPTTSSLRTMRSPS